MKRRPSGNIEKPSRLVAISSDDSSIVASNNSNKNKTLLGASDEEEHISPDTCDSYEYARDMSRIMPDINLSETRVNPFVRSSHLNRPQKIKLFFGAITLLPVRLALVSFILSILTPYGWLAYHLIGLFSFIFQLRTSTVVKLKYWLRWPLLWMIRVMLFVIGFYRIERVLKTSKLNSAQLLVAAPHRSIWDAIPYWCASQIYGNVAVASRYENSRIPILGSLLLMCDPILVKRDDPMSRSETRRLIQERSRYQKVLIYPEGTCTNGKHLVEFKTGAFIPGQEVQPMAIEYKLSDRHLDNVTWTWTGFRAWQLLFMTLCVWRTDLKLTILPPHKPKRSERHDSHVFARRVAQKLSRELAIPISRYSFDDAKLMELATELELPRSLASLRFLRLSYALHLEMCLKMSQDMPQEMLLMQEEAQLLADEIDTIDEVDFTSYTFKTLTVPDAIQQAMKDFMLRLRNVNELQMLQEITSRQGFVDALNINSKYSAKIIKTSVIDYLIKGLRCENVYSINLLNILLLMVLCDVRERNVAMRILTCMRLMSTMNRIDAHTHARANNLAGPNMPTGSGSQISPGGTSSNLQLADVTYQPSSHRSNIKAMAPTDQASMASTTSESFLHHRKLLTPQLEMGQAEHTEQSSNRSLEGRDGPSGRSLASSSEPVADSHHYNNLLMTSASTGGQQQQSSQTIPVNSLYDQGPALRQPSGHQPQRVEATQAGRSGGKERSEIIETTTINPVHITDTSSTSSSSSSVASFGNGESATAASVNITFEQFQLMIWLLLGIENLDKSFFPDSTNFSFDYVIDNLRNWFTRAVSENLPNARDLNAQRAKIDVAAILKTKPGNEKVNNKFLELVKGFD